VQDFVALEGAQQRGPDAQEGCLPCGRRAGAVDDAVEDCGGHERAWDRVRRGLGGREGRVTVEEGCVVAHGGCNWVGMRCLGMNVISLCECAYGVESIVWKELSSIMSHELKMVLI